ncbi:MAG TPA: Pycsar system effector family protein [Candidatus Acidoferrum sp.]|nr:Pycsar system effector family protein [Candidatus Acidoferrum sp.]
MTIQQPGAHLDHMLRQTRVHHVQLSSMADLKANMLLTLSSLIITFTAPHAFSPKLRWPVLTLLFFCLITIALAIYTVMPKIQSKASVNGDEAGSKPMFNLLFFGDFVRMPYAEFEAAMEKVLNDPSQLYEAQVREVYTLGSFLAAKKYRFLRLAYLSFLIGLFASAIVLVITLIA